MPAAPARPHRIGLISNRNSGHNRDQLANISARLKGCPDVLHIITNQAADLASALQEMAAANIEVLAVNGGDGTISTLLGYMLEHDIFNPIPQIILLPGGTANMNAGDIGASGKLTAAIERFCTWTRSGETPIPIKRHLMRVQLAPDQPPHYGMFLGLGAVIQGTEYAHEEIHSRGLRDDFSVALGVARTAWGVFRQDPRFARPLQLEFEVDDSGGKHRHEALIMVISSLQQLFLGMQPFWGQEPGPLRYTIIDQNPVKFPSTFISILRGKANRNAVAGNGYHSGNCTTLNLSLAGHINLDGEILEVSDNTGPIQITATPAFEFIQL
jgi:diacylglycerol kinase (ATP)